VVSRQKPLFHAYGRYEKGFSDFGGKSQPSARARLSGVTRKVSSYSIYKKCKRRKREKTG
jgi:hypothetical protein